MPHARRSPEAPSAPNDEPPRTTHLVREIADDGANLIRQEVELGRQEIQETLSGWLEAMAAIALAAVLGIATLVWVGFAAVAALDDVMPDWAASLVVAGAAAVCGGLAFLFARRRFRGRSIVPHRTRQSVREDFEWAKTQLKR